MLKYAFITGLGGFLGSSMRYLVQRVVGSLLPILFPYGTLVVNLSGAFLIGLFFAISEQTTFLGLIPEFSSSRGYWEDLPLFRLLPSTR